MSVVSIGIFFTDCLPNNTNENNRNIFESYSLNFSIHIHSVIQWLSTSLSLKK